MSNNSSHKRRFPEDDATEHARKRVKRQRIEFLVRRFQAEIQSDVKKDDKSVRILPLDWGSQLYTWFIEHANDIEDGGHRGLDDGRETPQDLPLSELKEPPKIDAGIRGVARTKGVLTELRHTLEERSRSQEPEGRSTSTSDVDPVFSPSEGNNTLGTSEAESVYNDAPKETGIRRQALRLRPPREPSRSDSSSPNHDGFDHTRAQGHPDTNAAQIPAATLTSIERPYDLPESWDQIHPADKMMICMRQENQRFTTIAEKWKEMTGHSDGTGHLEYRFRQLKQTLGLNTDEDIERVLIAEATARSKEELDEMPETIETGFDSRSPTYHSTLPKETNEHTTRASFVTQAKRRALKQDECHILEAGEVDHPNEISISSLYNPSEVPTDSKWVRLKLPPKHAFPDDVSSLGKRERPEFTTSKQVFVLPHHEAHQTSSRSSGIKLKFKTAPLPCGAFNAVDSPMIQDPASSRETSLETPTSEISSSSRPLKTKIPSLDSLGSNIRMSTKEKEIEYRLKLSKAAKEVWVKRRAVGLTSRGGRLPTASKIKLATSNQPLHAKSKATKPTNREGTLEHRRNLSEAAKAMWVRQVSSGRTSKSVIFPKLGKNQIPISNQPLQTNTKATKPKVGYYRLSKGEEVRRRKLSAASKAMWERRRAKGRNGRWARVKEVEHKTSQASESGRERRRDEGKTGRMEGWPSWTSASATREAGTIEGYD